MQQKEGMRLAGFIVILTMVIAGCPPSPIEVGPIRLDIPINSAEFLPEMMQSKALELDYTVQMDLCNLISEEEINALFVEISGFDLSQLVSLSRLELAHTKLTATQGDFSFLTSITLRYIPKPVDGVAQQPVILGAAYNENGFGTVIELIPDNNVDFIALIRANDANEGDGCPQLEFTMIPRSVPTAKTTFDALVSLDAYATLFPN